MYVLVHIESIKTYETALLRTERSNKICTSATLTFTGSNTRTPKTVPKTKDRSQSFVFSVPNSNEYKNVNVPPTAMQMPIKT